VIPELTKAGSSIEFKIYADEEKIGHIVIGHGSFTWYGKNRRNGKKYSWSKIAELMNGKAYK